jgi:hypothetical protein
MQRWYVAHAFFNPKVMVVYMYEPNGVVKAIFSWSSMAIWIWLYPEYASRKQSDSEPVTASMIWSILGG